MTVEEFEAKCKEQEDWAPGWEAIDGMFEKLYPGQEPDHYATNMVSRAMFGGGRYLGG